MHMVKDGGLLLTNCQQASRAKTSGLRGASITELCETTVQAEKILCDRETCL